MTHKIHIGLSVFFLSCATVPSKKLDSEVLKNASIFYEKVPFLEDSFVYRLTYKNGLKLLVLQDASAPTFVYETWYNVGSQNEELGKTGLAHLFEHMMFRGTENFQEGEFDRLLEKVGARGVNASTSQDFTKYTQALPKQHLELIIKLESDRMVNLKINQKSFDTEREVVKNERLLRTENSPIGLLHEKLFEKLFQNTSYGWPVIGYEKDLNAMTFQEAYQFYKKYYAPNNATIVVVGDVDLQEIALLVEKYYASIPQVELPVESIGYSQQSVYMHQQIPVKIETESFYMAYPCGNLMSADIPVLEVINTLLTQLEGEGLRKILIESQIASIVYSDVLHMKKQGAFIFYGKMHKNKKATQAEQLILKELAKLSSQPISLEKLEIAKKKIEFSFYADLEIPISLASFLGRYETIAKDFKQGMTILNATQKVTPAMIQAVIKKVFQPNYRTVMLGVPK